MKKSTLMSLIYGGLILFIFLIISLIVHYPIFTTSLLSMIGVVVGFVLTENMWTHDAAEFENRFWTFFLWIGLAFQTIKAPQVDHKGYSPFSSHVLLRMERTQHQCVPQFHRPPRCFGWNHRAADFLHHQWPDSQ